MSASLTRHLEKLCVEIGARPIGSPANDHAADYIRDVFAALGWAVEEQPYACTGWDCAAAPSSVGDEALAVEANAFSPACDVTAPAVPASTLDELAAADLTGKIALLHGELVGRAVVGQVVVPSGRARRRHHRPAGSQTPGRRAGPAAAHDPV